jgi:hypothetical protein
VTPLSEVPSILNDYVIIQLGGEAPPCIQLSIFFPLVFMSFLN